MPFGVSENWTVYLNGTVRATGERGPGNVPLIESIDRRTNLWVIMQSVIDNHPHEWDSTAKATLGHERELAPMPQYWDRFVHNRKRAFLKSRRNLSSPSHYRYTNLGKFLLILGKYQPSCHQIDRYWWSYQDVVPQRWHICLWRCSTLPCDFAIIDCLRPLSFTWRLLSRQYIARVPTASAS